MTGTKGHSGGSNRLPTALKELQGTLKPSRTNTREPNVAFGLPDPPAWLRADSVEHYERIGALALESGVISLVDGEALALAAKAITDLLKLDDELEAHGYLISESTKDGNERTKINPAASAYADAWRRYKEGLRLFGLDPQSRGSVMAINGLGQKPAEGESGPTSPNDFFGPARTDN